MDKRTALAFVLMFVILLIWQTVWSPPKNQTDGDSDSDSLRVAQVSPPAKTSSPEFESRAQAQSEEAAEAAVTEEEYAELATSSEGPVVVLETDRYRAELDLVGGDLRSWELKQYHYKSGEDVQLIPERSLDVSGERAHALRIFTENRIYDLERVSFEVRGEGLVPTGDPRRPFRLVLDEDRPTAELVLTARVGSGTPFRLELFLDNASSSFDVRAVLDTPRTQLARLELAWPSGIANSEPDTTREYNEFKAVARVGDDKHQKKFNDLKKGDGSKGRAGYQGTVAWAGVMSQYFTSFVDLPGSPLGSVRFDGDYTRRLQSFAVEAPLQTAEGPGLDYTVYMGALDYNRLKSIDPQLVELIDLGPSFFRPVTKLTLALLIFLHGLIPNYGWVIILLSVATKFLFYPLTKSSTRSMREMQLVQPELAKLKEKYKDDQQRQSSEMMKLYKEHGINPMAGCLPLLVQMPVFWALFTVLRKTIELRQEPFALWINDLSLPDVLFELPVTLPVLGSHFSLLPFLMAAGMWLQTKIGTPSGAGTGEGAMAQQQRMMTTFMPLFMLFIFYNTPSGLVLYWLVNTILTIGQTWQIHRNAPKTLAEKKAMAA